MSAARRLTLALGILTAVLLAVTAIALFVGSAGLSPRAVSAAFFPAPALVGPELN